MGFFGHRDRQRRESNFCGALCNCKSDTRLSRIIITRPTLGRKNNSLIRWQLTVLNSLNKRSIDEILVVVWHRSVPCPDQKQTLAAGTQHWNSEKGRGWEGIPLIEKNWSQVTISWSKVCLINTVTRSKVCRAEAFTAGCEKSRNHLWELLSVRGNNSVVVNC